MSHEAFSSLNPVVAFLKKPAAAIDKNDLIRYVRENGVRMVNFMYPAGDGRLKTLNFVVSSEAYLDEILSCGERVDGSSLFSFIETGSSDLYVVPRFRTAFLDPFARLPTLTLLCSFFDKHGSPLDCSPEYTLQKACRAFTQASGLDFHAMGELEYYVIDPINGRNGFFPAVDQRGYHESGPYAKFEPFRTQCMQTIAQVGGCIKYGHGEVGNFTQNSQIYEQNEIEFLPVPAEEAADQLMLAKWIIRNLAYANNVRVTFAPKITVGKAGSGLHVHMCLMRDGRNVMLENGQLTDSARKAIAGLMRLAPALTAFGNTCATSYFRLVPHQEAPTSVCWGDQNRSVLVRVPLGWSGRNVMCATANPQASGPAFEARNKQTVEIRSPDGSADLYALLAGLAVACRHGFEMPDALDVARRTYVNVNIHKDANRNVLEKLDRLPDSCAASADCLAAQRAVFEQQGVFSPRMIDGAIDRLKRLDDRPLRERLAAHTETLVDLVERDFNCG